MADDRPRTRHSEPDDDDRRTRARRDRDEDEQGYDRRPRREPRKPKAMLFAVIGAAAGFVMSLPGAMAAHDKSAPYVLGYLGGGAVVVGVGGLLPGLFIDRNS